MSGVHVVTGALGYSGRYIAEILLARGERLRALTGHPDRPNPFGDRVAVVPFRFDSPEKLSESLRGADILYNTYWIRFERGPTTFDRAVANSEVLFRAAAEAGVGRIVHISITNPSEDSPFPYFRGKARVERMLRESGVSHAILRPTVLFGKEDILINNIAWLLRRLRVFGVFGSGDYRLRPAYVGDMARLAVELAGGTESVTLDAVGPETYAFADLIRLIRQEIGSSARLVQVRPGLAMAAARTIGWIKGDVVITRDEIDGLMANLLVTDGPATCHTSFAQWTHEHASELGRRYASELGRHYR